MRVHITIWLDYEPRSNVTCAMHDKTICSDIGAGWQLHVPSCGRSRNQVTQHLTFRPRCLHNGHNASRARGDESCAIQPLMPNKFTLKPASSSSPTLATRGSWHAEKNAHACESSPSAHPLTLVGGPDAGQRGGLRARARAPVLVDAWAFLRQDVQEERTPRRAFRCDQPPMHLSLTHACRCKCLIWSAHTHAHVSCMPNLPSIACITDRSASSSTLDFQRWYPLNQSHETKNCPPWCVMKANETPTLLNAPYGESRLCSKHGALSNVPCQPAPRHHSKSCVPRMAIKAGRAWSVWRVEDKSTSAT